MEEILDGQMIVNSRTLFSVIALELEENQFYEVPEFFDNYVRYNTGELGTYYSNNLYDDYDSEFYMQLVDPFGHTVFSSNGTELVKNTNNFIDSTNSESGFSKFKEITDNETWRVFGLKDSNSGYSFFTAHTESVRKELSREAIRYMFEPLVVGTILIVFAIWAAITIGLRPLRSLGDELDSRDLRSVKPIQQSHTMNELKPVVNSLNRLFRRMSAMLVNEQRFSADVSHELRTPLARIMANTDALSSMTTDSEQLRVIENITLSTNHAKALAEDLLLLSKLGNDGATDYFENESFDVLNAIKTEMGQFEAESTNSSSPFRLSVLGDKSTTLQGSSSLFSILIKNLLDNTLKYSKKNTPIDVTVSSEEELKVTIRDYGPGVAEDKLDKLFERFYRTNNSNDLSTGLGLAISKSIANYFAATITATNAKPTGLSITLAFQKNSLMTA